jgi:hypothetical protein
MPDDEKPDPFKPQQPQIPGVSNAPAAKSAKVHPDTTARVIQPSRSGKLVWPGVALAVVLVIALGIAKWSGGTNAPATAASLDEGASVAPERAKPAVSLPMGPGPIATTEELAKTWSSREFEFRNAGIGETVPAIVVHLPGNVYWAFSLREPYGNCTLEYVTDFQRLKSEYNYTSDTPVVADPCNHAIFDLTKYGPGPNGLVRGQIVQGEGIRPPIAIEVRVKDKDIIAVRSE